MPIIDPRPGYSHQHQCRATSDPEPAIYEYGEPKPVYAGVMLEQECATRTTEGADNVKVFSPIEQAVELQRRASVIRRLRDIIDGLTL